MNNKIKILVGVSLTVFVISVTAVLAAGLVLLELKKELTTGGSATGTKGLLAQLLGGPEASAQPALEPGEQTPVLTTEEVAKHNQSSNCWIMLDNNVYNVTSFLSQHPGNASTITPYCGKDAKPGFVSKDKNPARDHSSLAYEMLKGYFIGTIGQQLAGNGTPTQGVNLPNQTPVRVQPRASVVAVIPASNQNTTTIPPANSAPPSVTLTLAEIGTHNTRQNCWIVVSNVVYDVTSYISQHPGGANEITNTCGTDATNAFQSRGGTGSHSQNARNLLSNYAVGTLGSDVTVNPPTSGGGGSTTGGGGAATTQPSPSPQQGGGGSGQSSGLPSSVQSKYPGATNVSINQEDDGRMEIKLNYNGECRSIKTNSAGDITEDKSC